MLKDRSWRAWYSDPRHRRRRDHQLRVQPLCEDCLTRGRHTPATVAHHITPHKGDINLFLRSPLRSLCGACHNKLWASDKRGFSSACDVTGKPIDPAHPALVERPYKELPADDLDRPYEDEGLKPYEAPRVRSLPRHVASLLARQQPGRKRAR
jgi:5-methylcytosine-specific restriction protein A